MLAICAIGADLLQAATGSRLMMYVKDGGEILAITGACIVAHTLHRGYRRPELAARLRLPMAGMREPAARA